MSEDIGNESGAISESTASSETASPAQSQEAAPGQEAGSVKQEVPFHEHPRFKELVEQKNQFSSEAKQLREAYQQLQSQMQSFQQSQNQPKTQDFKSEYIEYLKKADPKFAEYQAQLLERVERTSGMEQEIGELRKGYETYQQQAAISQFDRLCSDNKVGEEEKMLYRAYVANAANQRGASYDQLPSLFKEAHDQLSKYFEGRDRKVTASYQQKKVADKTPTKTTGGQPAAAAAKGGPADISSVKDALAQALRNGMKL